MNSRNNKSGSALLLVLFVVMIITVLSLCFVNKSDKELLISKNMSVRAKADFHCRSALEHARTMISNPQVLDDSVDYWQGIEKFQLDAGSDNFYDISVESVNFPNIPKNKYIVTCSSYEDCDGDTTAEQTVEADLKLYPAIGLLCSGSWANSVNCVIRGDVYCGGDFSGNAVFGDAFIGGSASSNSISGNNLDSSQWYSINMPSIAMSDFSDTYRYESKTYSVHKIEDSKLTGFTFIPDSSNPAGILYREGDLTLGSGNFIKGFLIVTGKLKIEGMLNFVRGVKNYPAVVVGSDMQLSSNKASINVQGLIKVTNKIVLADVSDLSLSVNGLLAVGAGGLEIQESPSANITIISDPVKATLCYEGLDDTLHLWKPFKNAYYTSIVRK